MMTKCASTDQIIGGFRLLSAADVHFLDAAAAARGTPTVQLMERAGRAVAAVAESMSASPGRVAVVCGPGNNGGDGYVAARLLAARGFDVAVTAPLGPPRQGSDAQKAAELWDGPILDMPTVLLGCDLVIDALFGVGLSRPIAGPAADAVAAMNDSRARVLAVDIPSGVSSDDGLVPGIAVRATRTVTFGGRKPGHLLQPGRRHAGLVETVDIGLGAHSEDLAGPATFANEPGLWLPAFPQPRHEGHKYERGHALVLSGPIGTSGAARLAARAAARMGAGLVTIASPASALPAHAAQISAIMLRACEDAADLGELLGDRRYSALVIGPGAGREPGRMREIVAVAAEAGRALVLDADALTAYEGCTDELARLLARCPAVLTPHEGEFARLTSGIEDFGNMGSRLARARHAAAILGAVVVLKGSDTIIAAPDGRAAINETGSPYLATAGSGDVLAGAIGGLLAQGTAPFEAACASVWLHGKAGEIGGIGLVADDLPLLLREAQHRLLSERN